MVYEAAMYQHIGLYTERQAPHTQFLSRLKAEPVLEEIGEKLFRGSEPKTVIMAVAGRNGSGKSFFISQSMAWMEQQAREKGSKINVSYVPYASVLEYGKTRPDPNSESGWLINPNTPHGSYTEEEYRRASKLQASFVTFEANNHEARRLIIVETTGPTAYIDENGRVVGKDRGHTTLEMLAHRYSDEAIAVVVNRSPALMRVISAKRQSIADSSPEDLPDVLEAAGMKIAEKGRIVDLRRKTPEERAIYRDDFIKGASASKGMEEANAYADWLKEHWVKTDDELVMWHAFMTNAGRDLRYRIVHNDREVRKIIVHGDLRKKYDVVKRMTQV